MRESEPLANLQPSSAADSVPMALLSERWVHVLFSMFEGGDARRMGPTGFFVYVALKTYTDLHTGKARVSLETLARITDLSTRQVARAVKRLVEQGYARRQRSGRQNTYVVREYVPLVDGEDRVVGRASWDYAGGLAAQRLEQLKRSLLEGQSLNGRAIHIEQLNVQINTVPASVQINIAGLAEKASSPDLRRALETIARRVGQLEQG